MNMIGKRNEGASTVAGELRVLIGKLGRRLREETNPGNLSWSQISVIGWLDRDGPATVTALARAEGVQPQSMGATVSALEAAGLVSRAADPNDGRQTVLSLTDSARAMIKANRAAREDWLFRAIQTRFATREQQQLAAGVALLKRLLDR